VSEKTETRTWFVFLPCDVVRLRAGYSLVYDDRTMTWEYLANAPEDDCEAADD